jgi:phosphoenolpyruvate carboxykinase (GTP)
VENREWLEECTELEQYYAQFGDRLPPGISEELEALKNRLS